MIPRLISGIILSLILWIPTTGGAGNFDSRDRAEFIRIYNAMKQLDESSVECMAANIYHEARGEPWEGQVAVSYVVLNRAEQWGKSICSTVHRKAYRYVDGQRKTTCAFTWVCDSSKLKANKKLYDKYKFLARYIMVKGVRDYSKGSLFYHTTAVRPKWHDDYKVMTKIGDHLFLS